MKKKTKKKKRSIIQYRHTQLTLIEIVIRSFYNALSTRISILHHTTTIVTILSYNYILNYRIHNLLAIFENLFDNNDN